MIFNLIFTFAFAQSLVMGPDVDLSTLKMKDEQLISHLLLAKYTSSELRPEILKDSEDYLKQTISDSVYFSNLKLWNQAGWSDLEKQIVLDTIQKSSAEKNLKNEWTCRLSDSSDCGKKVRLDRLPEYLKNYDWIVVGGTAYPRNRWDLIEVSNFVTRFVFISSKYKTIDLVSKPADLKLPVLVPEPWVSGHCSQYHVSEEVQSLESTVYFNQSCQKPTIVKMDSEPSFYKKHKEKIWWTAFGVAVLGAVTMSGKKLVFTY